MSLINRTPCISTKFKVLPCFFMLWLLSAALVRCGGSAEGSTPLSTTSASKHTQAPAPSASQSQELSCSARQQAVRDAIEKGVEQHFSQQPVLDDKTRAEILGRARGEPLLFVREPRQPESNALSKDLQQHFERYQKEPAGARVVRLRQALKANKPALRSLLLREGYVYSSDPHDSLAIVTQFRIADLFDEQEIWLHRASQQFKLTRASTRGEIEYRYTDGPYANKPVDLLWGDRFAIQQNELAEPLHRDLLHLQDELGFDRFLPETVTTHHIVAKVRFGTGKWFRMLFDTQQEKIVYSVNGATFLDADKDGAPCFLEDQAKIHDFQILFEQNKARREALKRVHSAITKEVDEQLRFDRPEGVKNAEHDGKLRPSWASAYQHGQAFFSHDGHSYPVFDASGKPWPPQVCVDLVLDTFERASGTWFAEKPNPPNRKQGALDFDTYGIPNRRAVLAFETFAKGKPELFEHRRFEGTERIPFAERSRFFSFLLVQDQTTDTEIQAGDVVAIQGLKADGLIHQHAIFVERTDPVSGFVYGLADQMKRPRRRTWDGIMAEAPARSLLYRVRPKMILWEKIASGQPLLGTPKQVRPFRCIFELLRYGRAVRSRSASRSAKRLGGFIAACVLATVTMSYAADDVVAKVGNVEIHEAELARRIAITPRMQLVQFGNSPDEIRKNFLQKVLIPEALFSQSAQAKKTTDEPGVRVKLLDIYRGALLQQLKRERGDKSEISEADARKYYDTNIEKYRTSERFAISRILLASKDEAQKVLDEVKQPGGEKKWNDLAREKSLDKTNHERGGNLGFVSPEGQSSDVATKVDPAILAAAKKLKDGEFAPEPVQEEKGFSVLWRRGSLPAVTRPFEQEFAQIKQILARQRSEGSIKSLLENLRNEHVRDVNEGLLGLIEISSSAEILPAKKQGADRPKAPGKPQPSMTPAGLR